MALDISKIKNSKEFSQFLEFSKEIGKDISMVQAAGGNTSMKLGDTMWVKASGKWLINACAEEIMVPVNISKVKTILKNEEFSEKELSVSKISDDKIALRPSVETPLHAVLDFKYVLHTHDVNVISIAIQNNSQALFKNVMSEFNWKFLPYIKPGIELSKQLLAIKSKSDNVFVLQNHGLIVCGDSLDEIKQLNLKIRESLENEVIKKVKLNYKNDIRLEINLQNTEYKFLNEDYAFTLANNKTWLKKISFGSFLPDLLVFLGPKVLTIEPDPENLSMILNKLSELSLPLNACVILAGVGVIVRKDSLKGTAELIRLLYELMLRVPDEANLEYFNNNQISELLNWEAEHYRQHLNKINQ